MQITADALTPALALAEPEPDHGSKAMTVTLDFMEREPSGLGKLFGSKGVGLSVEVRTFQPGGPHYYFCDVIFPRRLDLHAAFARAGLEWPVWWVVPEVSHLIDKATRKSLSVAGFGRPEYVLPWFVRLHAAVAGRSPSDPVFVRRSVSTLSGDMSEFEGTESPADFMYELSLTMEREATDERLKQEAYAAWLEREAEWKRSTGQA